MNSKPAAKVAVIMRTKNRPLLLRRAMESVIQQAYQDWLLVIVNDGGEIAPVKQLEQQFQERLNGRCVIVSHLVSRGMEAASNSGITACDSQYIVIHDDDDSWHPDFLSTAVKALEAESSVPHVGGVVTQIARVVEKIEGDVVTEISRADCGFWLDDLSLWRVAAGNNFPPISFLYKRSVIDAIGLYDERLPVLGDWEFNLRFLRQFNIIQVPRTLAYYHHREASAEAAYQSTLVGQLDAHQQIDRMLRNEKLRVDLATGRFGEGAMMNIATQMRTSRERTEALLYQQAQILDANMQGLFRAVHTRLDDEMNALHTSLKQLHEHQHSIATRVERLYVVSEYFARPVRWLKKLFTRGAAV